MKRHSVLLSLLFLSLFGHSQTPINAKTSSKYVSKGRYQWKIYITGSSTDLRNISYVVYNLHPTYPSPRQKIENRNNSNPNFCYSASGWGNFEVVINIFFKNSRPSQTLKHNLRLRNDPQFSPCRG
jgi:transcription initiation factor IIF auxiliary subunit